MTDPEARQTLAETITPVGDDTGDVERGSWEGDCCPRSLTVAHETVLAGIPTRAERQKAAEGREAQP